jgi:hypothetical protein
MKDLDCDHSWREDFRVPAWGATRAFRDPRSPHGRERKHPQRRQSYGRQIVESMKEKPNRNTAMRKLDARDHEMQAVLVVATHRFT